MIVFTPPHQISLVYGQLKSIFLAGTIDMGNSVDWQKELIESLNTYKVEAVIFNPRRADWNSEWKQGIEQPQFYQQVNWELDALKKADIIVMNLAENSKSPISLLELGLYANSGKLLVCCPDGFYRSGNVQIVCNNYNIPLYKDMDLLISDLLKQIKNE